MSKDQTKKTTAKGPMASYVVPTGGLPGQKDLLTDRAQFTNSFAVIPKGTMRDIVTSFMPFWEKARFWVLARPLSGFAETFSQAIVELDPGGGSDRPENQPDAECVLFVVSGELQLELDGQRSRMHPGGFAYIPPGLDWTCRNETGGKVTFHWIRKRYEKLEGLDLPDPVITHEALIEPKPMPDTNGAWATTHFVPPDDLRHDMHVTIVTLQPGATIPFLETHVMEHGLYVLQGKAAYRLNQDWVEVEAGDFMWLRAFCPQACYAGGPEPFRYLLYKDVNRLPKLALGV